MSIMPIVLFFFFKPFFIVSKSKKKKETTHTHEGKETVRRVLSREKSVCALCTFQ